MKEQHPPTLHPTQSPSGKQHHMIWTQSTDSWRELPNATAILVL